MARASTSEELLLDAEKKAKVARTLGFILVGLALVNVTIFIMKTATGRESSAALLSGACTSLLLGIIMLTRGKGKSGPSA